MKILGIESSCDETAVAIVTEDREILSNLVLSQHKHQIYGGVVPEIAARAHLDHVDILVQKALQDSKLTLTNIDAIAVTAGPGLMGGLLVGVMTARAIGAVTGKPVIPVNHLEGHALTARLTDNVSFPYLLLLVSGGHTQILIVKGVGHYQHLGGTRDDAAGEAFDKTAKLLGLGYPGGPLLERHASLCQTNPNIELPRPLLGTDGCDFSFSGLKSAVRRVVEQHPDIDTAKSAAIAKAFQNAMADIVADRIENAIQVYKQLSPAAPLLVVAGGVAANKTLQQKLQITAQNAGLAFSAPPLQFCTDNAAMIAWAGLEHFRLGTAIPETFPVLARWPLDPDSSFKKGRPA